MIILRIGKPPSDAHAQQTERERSDNVVEHAESDACGGLTSLCDLWTQNSSKDNFTVECSPRI